MVLEGTFEDSVLLSACTQLWNVVSSWCCCSERKLCPAGKSNSGEGGEDPQRWENLGDVDDKGNSPTFPHLKGLQSGDVASSCIKQVSLLPSALKTHCCSCRSTACPALTAFFKQC